MWKGDRQNIAKDFARLNTSIHQDISKQRISMNINLWSLDHKGPQCMEGYKIKYYGGIYFKAWDDVMII